MDEEGLNISPIFSGLTRPAMFLGVTPEYLFICFMCSFGVFALTSHPIYMVIWIPLHIYGWLACRFDPNYFRVLFKLMECPMTMNKKLWGTKNYEPF